MVEMFLTFLIVTHVSILSSDTSNKSDDLSSQAYGMLRYRSYSTYEPASSVYHFSPVTFSTQEDLIRLVSYYAFFKGWLLLSQPPSCFGFLTFFPT